jgi:hypothetical protein
MMEDSVNMKQKIEDILTETGYSEQRAAKMSVDDLLKYVLPNAIDTSLTCAFLSQTTISIPRRWHSLCMIQNADPMLTSR